MKEGKNKERRKMSMRETYENKFQQTRRGNKYEVTKKGNDNKYRER